MVENGVLRLKRTPRNGATLVPGSVTMDLNQSEGETRIYVG